MWHFAIVRTPTILGMLGVGSVRLAAASGCGRLGGMTMSSNLYRGFRFPREVIEHAVWLYHCFSLSLRDVELILAARGSSSATRASASGACASAGSSPMR